MTAVRVNEVESSPFLLVRFVVAQACRDFADARGEISNAAHTHTLTHTCIYVRLRERSLTRSRVISGGPRRGLIIARRASRSRAALGADTLWDNRVARSQGQDCARAGGACAAHRLFCARDFSAAR